MQFYSFEVVIEKEAEDEGYYTWSPSLPGCFSNGRTVEDAKRNMRTAVVEIAIKDALKPRIEKRILAEAIIA